MKDKTKTILGMSLIIVGVVLLFGSFVYDMVNSPKFKPTQKETNCYDKFGNEIIGQGCLDKTTYYPGMSAFPLAIIGSVIILGGILVLSLRTWLV